MTIRDGHLETMVRLFTRVYDEHHRIEDALYVVLSEHERGKVKGREHSASDIIAAVCSRMLIGEAELRGMRRYREPVGARWVAMQLMQDDGMTIKGIASSLGVATCAVRNGLHRVGGRVDLMAHVEALRNELFKEGRTDAEMDEAACG